MKNIANHGLQIRAFRGRLHDLHVLHGEVRVFLVDQKTCLIRKDHESQRHLDASQTKKPLIPYRDERLARGATPIGLADEARSDRVRAGRLHTLSRLTAGTAGGAYSWRFGPPLAGPFGAASGTGFSPAPALSGLPPRLLLPVIALSFYRISQHILPPWADCRQAWGYLPERGPG